MWADRVHPGQRAGSRGLAEEEGEDEVEALEEDTVVAAAMVEVVEAVGTGEAEGVVVEVATDQDIRMVRRRGRLLTTEAFEARRLGSGIWYQVRVYPSRC